MENIIEKILEIFREILIKMSDEEKKKIYDMLKEATEKKKFFVNYTYKSNSPDDKPYIAELVIRQGKLERKFYNLEQRKTSDNKMEYTAKIEINPEAVYEIKEKGKYFIYVCDDSDKKLKLIGERTKLFNKVMSYLNGNITKKELITTNP